MKLAIGSNSFHVGSIGVPLVGTGLAPQLGGRGRLQLDPMLLPPPPQTMPPSENWQDSGAACLLFSTAVCCCPVHIAAFPLAAFSLVSNGREGGIMAGMLAFGGGGHVVATAPKSVEQMNLFWS